VTTITGKWIVEFSTDNSDSEKIVSLNFQSLDEHIGHLRGEVQIFSMNKSNFSFENFNDITYLLYI